MKMRNIGTALAAAVMFAVAGNAAVSITVTKAAGPAAPAGYWTAVDFQTHHSFSWLTAPEVATGSLANKYAAPTGDTTAYGYVSTNPAHDTAVLNMSAIPVKGLSIYIGSLDNYNSITFYTNKGNETFTGWDLFELTGVKSDGNHSSNFLFDFGGATLNKIAFRTTQNSFEFDNIAVAAVPEPAIWAMLLTGFGLAGAFLRLRPKMVTA